MTRRGGTQYCVGAAIVIGLLCLVLFFASGLIS